jgi:hypothetical protein
MSNALDEFEAALVEASRALGAEARTPAPATTGPRQRRGRLHRLRHLSMVAQLAFALTSVSALGGAATGAYLWLAGGSPGTQALPSFECTLGAGPTTVGTLGASAITGDPLIDCAAALLQIRGRRPPRLLAWGNGVQTAVVRAAGSGPPPFGGVWHLLPAGWTVDLHVVELNDQLNDISAGMADGPACTYAAHAVRVARSLLAADGLHGWHVTLHANNGPLVRACRHVAPEVEHGSRTIELIQIQELGAPVHVPALQRRRQREYFRALASLRTLQDRGNHVLDARCESVAQAARLWQREARAAGFTPATAAFWREVQALGDSSRAGPTAIPSDFFMRYTLLRQPTSQRTGSCAHLLIQDNGGDQLIVYAARMAP